MRQAEGLRIMATNQSQLIANQKYLVSVLRVIVNGDAFKSPESELQQLDQITGILKSMTVIEPA